MGLVIPVFISHRGCPHQCLFCNQHAISGKEQGNRATIQAITGTVEEWLARSPGHDDVQVAFYGGSFTCLDQDEQLRMLKAIEPYIARGRVQSIRMSTRPDCVTEDIAHWLKSMHVKTVELGVQSLSDKVLQLSQRGHTADDSRRAVSLLKKAGIEVGVQLLPGLPGDTTQTFLTTVRETVKLQPDLIRLYPAVVVEGSELANMYRQGIYTPLSMNRAIGLTRRAKELFDAAAIPVVRMGLQPSETLEKQIVAGPYHPAFGELVKSRSWLRQIREHLSRLKEGEKLGLHLSHRDVSAVVGMKKMNLHRLEQLGFKDRYIIIPDKNRARGSIEYVVS